MSVFTLHLIFLFQNFKGAKSNLIKNLNLEIFANFLTIFRSKDDERQFILEAINVKSTYLTMS